MSRGARSAPYGFWNSSQLAVADHARQRSHRALEPAAQGLEMLGPAVRVERFLRCPLLDEDELDVVFPLQRAEQVVADAPGLLAGGLDQVPKDGLHLIFLPYLGVEDGDHVNGVLRHSFPSRG